MWESAEVYCAELRLVPRLFQLQRHIMEATSDGPIYIYQTIYIETLVDYGKIALLCQ